MVCTLGLVIVNLVDLIARLHNGVIISLQVQFMTACYDE